MNKETRRVRDEHEDSRVAASRKYRGEVLRTVAGGERRPADVQDYNEKIVNPWNEQNRMEDEIRRQLGVPPDMGQGRGED